MANGEAYNFTPADDNIYSENQEINNSVVKYLFVSSDDDISVSQPYDTNNQNISATLKINVVYESKSHETDDIEKTSIIRAIEYKYIAEISGRHLFNLAFGVYNIEDDKIIDDVVTNGGDVYKVFYTVLNSVPKFFEHYKSSVLMVRGSDSGPEFIETCKQSCRKKCAENICKNADRRIKIYQSYVDKNYDELCKTYTFYGGITENNMTVPKPYEKGAKYESVFLIKNN